MDLVHFLSPIEGAVIVWLAILTLVNMAVDVDELWIINGLLFVVVAILTVAIGQPLWMTGIFLIGALLCVIRLIIS